MIKLIKKVISLVFSPLVKFLDFPAVPAELAEMFDLMLGYFKEAMVFLNVFVSVKLISTLLGVVIVLEAIKYGYKLVYWVIQKVPFLGVE